MKYVKLIGWLALCFTAVDAQQVYENNLFVQPQEQLAFKTEQQLSDYIKTNKPSTFRYFERLNFSGKK